MSGAVQVGLDSPPPPPSLVIPPRTASRTGVERPLELDRDRDLGLNTPPRRPPRSQKRTQLPPTGTRTGSVAAGVPAFTLDLEASSVILVRDPPRERLPRSRSSADSEHDEAPLARIPAKPDIRLPYPIHIPITTTTTTTTTTSVTTAGAEYYGDLRDEYQDATTPTKSRPTPTPTPTPSPNPNSARPRSHSRSRSRTPGPASNSHAHSHTHTRATTISHPETQKRADADAPEIHIDFASSSSPSSSSSLELEREMAKKRRGSLQAIFVPSFLNALGAHSQPHSQSHSPSQTQNHTPASSPPPSPLPLLVPLAFPSSPTGLTTPGAGGAGTPGTPGAGGGNTVGGTIGKYASRMRALSALGPGPPPPSPSAGSNLFSSMGAATAGAGGGGGGGRAEEDEDAQGLGQVVFLPPDAQQREHGRKRSTTFSFGFSSHSSSGSGALQSSSSGLSPTAGAGVYPDILPGMNMGMGMNSSMSISSPSPRSSPPPAFLLDDDPFANLSSVTAAPASIGLGHSLSRIPSSGAGPSRLGQDVVPPVPPLPPALMLRSPLFESPPRAGAGVGSGPSSSANGGGVGTPLTSLTIPANPGTGSVSAPSSSSTLTTPALTPSSSISSVSSASGSSSSTPSITSTPLVTSPISITSPTTAQVLGTSPSIPPVPSSIPSSSGIPSSISSLIPSSSSGIPPSPPPLPRPPPPGSTARAQTRPAHQRPAFASRPSLPSLDTLARMNVVLTRKVRKGRVGAGLPFEPWDNLPSDDEYGSRPQTPVAGSMAAVMAAANSSSASGSNPNASSPTSSTVPSSPTTPTSMSPATPALSPSSSAATSPMTSFASSPAMSFASASTSTSAAAAAAAAVPIAIPVPPRSDSIHPPGSSSSSTLSRPGSPSATLGSASTTPTSPKPISSPKSMTMAKPQPLLPSQILALGSVAEDVEMILPVPYRQAQMQMPLPMQVQVQVQHRQEQQQHSWSQPAPSAPGGYAQSSNANSGYLRAYGEEREPPFSSNRPMPRRDSMDDEAEDGYFGGDFLDRYQSESRGGSEDGHGSVFGHGQLVDDVKEVEREEKVPTPATATFGTQQVELGVTANIRHLGGDMEHQDRAYELSSNHPYSNHQRQASHNDDGPNPIQNRASSPGASGSGSLIFSSSPPSFESASLTHTSSNSVSSSASSFSSAGSAGAVEGVDHELGHSSYEMDGDEEHEQDEEIVFGGSRLRQRQRHHSRNMEYRRMRLAEASASLSSLELDAEAGHSLGLGLERLSDLDNDLDRDAVDSRRGDSTRSSSSHPSLSRTRSSSDDSDMLRSPVMGDHDYSFFPYSRAMALQSLYGHQHHGVEQEYESPAAASEVEATSSFAVRPAEVAEVGVSQGMGFGFDRVAGEVLDEKKLDPENEARSVDVSRTTAFINGLRSDEGLDAYLNSPSASSYDPEFAVASTSSSLDHQHHQRTSRIPPMPSTNLVPHTTPPSPDHLSLEREHATVRGMTSGPGSPAPLHSLTTQTTMSPVLSTLNGEPYDSSGYRGHPPPALSSTSQSSRTGSSHGQTSTSNRSNGFGSAYSSTTSRLIRGRQRGNSDDEDEDEDRRRRRALERMRVDEFGMKSPSSSEDEVDTDKYGPPSASSSKNNLLRPPWNPGPVSRSPSTAESFVTAPSGSPSPMPMDFPSTSSNSSRYASEDDDDDDNDDDDVPLAQRIPGALIAQKSMRRQFRQEREQRKQEKTVKQESEADRRARQMTLRPAGAGAGGVVDGSGVGTAGSSSHDAALLAVAAAAAAASSAPPTAPAPPQRRQRTLTLPTKSPGAPIFNPHDLAKKLQNVQMAESPAHQLQTFQQQQMHHHHHQQQQQLSRSQTHHSKSVSKSSGDQQHLLSPPFAPSPPMSSPAMRSRSVKEPSNSLHQPFSPSPTTSMHAPPVPALRSMRSFHRPSSSHRPAGTEGPRSSPLPEADQRLGRSSTTSNHRSSNEGYIRRSTSQSRISGERTMRTEEPVPPLPFNRSARPSIDHGTDREEQRKAMKGHPSPEVRVHSKRPSTADPERPRTSSSQHQPQPQLQPANVIMKPVVSQQRIFVGNLQQFHMVEISPSTTAGDVIAMMDSQGILKGWAGSGGWMVFEIAQDFGMERPVRSYELLADVQSSWLKDKTVNYFVLRLTPLAVPLSRSAIPSSSPTHSGYVEWEVKRGKWSKRWLQLREHSLWLSKRDNRKDEVLICSLSNFDAYNITRNHRAPKPYAFAIKSTDNLSFFESAADYLHNFSCSEKDGSVWMEKILVARSYVLHQEKQVLFSPKSPAGNASAPLARSGTKKHPPPRTLQPLIPLLHNDVFEPGSLLANHL